MAKIFARVLISIASVLALAPAADRPIVRYTYWDLWLLI